MRGAGVHGVHGLDGAQDLDTGHLCKLMHQEILARRVLRKQLCVAPRLHSSSHSLHLRKIPKLTHKSGQMTQVTQVKRLLRPSNPGS
jgi:hypothetical protein